MKKRILTFPKGFLWGSAVSAYQVEGGNIYSDWWAWEHSEKRLAELKQNGKDPEKYQSGDACDFYHRFREDIGLASNLGQNAFRLSLEWSRIEPEEGKFSSEAVGYYREVLKTLRQHKMSPVVTLFHFTVPQWFAEKGGFEKKKNIGYFLRYLEYAVKDIADQAEFWITINEPEIYSTHAYSLGKWPPQRKSALLSYRVMNNLISAHHDSVGLIRRISSKPIGVSVNITDLQAEGVFSIPAANIVDYILNKHTLRRMAGSLDFIGLNYYNHAHISWFGRRHSSKTHHVTTDLGWGVHPEGIERVLAKLAKYSLPIYITENGIADAADSRRAKFIRDHLFYIHRALQSGVDVRGYFYWSLLDNFEWHHGFWPRFGLVAVDYSTQARFVRPSAHEYAKICRSNGFTIST